MAHDEQKPTDLLQQGTDPTAEFERPGLWSGTSRRVPDAAGRAADSMLAVFGERLTYTFICGDEVASIHFDQGRGEIFFRGHNIKFMELDGQQLQALLALEEILVNDREGRTYFAAYHATLAKILTDKQQ